MRMYVEDSLDGSTWRPLFLVGSQVTFDTKKAAKAWFTALKDANTLDWSVGFIHRYSDGHYYRLVYKDGREVKY